MARLVGIAEDFPLTAGRYGVAISWDSSPGCNVDVDLQAVIVDGKGQVIDAVYYNNLKALGSLTHSGDETTGERSGFDEMIWINTARLPEHVRMIVFVVAAFNGGHLRDAKNGKIHVLEQRKDNEVASFAIEESKADVDAVAMMVKSDKAWVLRIVEEPALEGQHFMDILEPIIGNLVRGVLPGAPRRLKAAFAMEKSAVMDLPQSSEIKQIVAGLGWDTANGNVDLDVSAVLFDNSGKDRDAIFFGNLTGSGLQHSGDNLTGEGSGDDETIVANLEAIPEWAHQVVLCVNIYTPGVTFEQVANPYCRILDAAGNELARYALKEADAQNGLIIARLFREDSARWGFQAIGSFCRGNTYKDSLADMVELVRQTPRELQMRGAPARSSTAAVSVAAPPPPKSSTCCVH